LKIERSDAKLISLLKIQLSSIRVGYDTIYWTSDLLGSCLMALYVYQRT